jgi:hypothetical protein
LGANHRSTRQRQGTTDATSTSQRHEPGQSIDDWGVGRDHGMVDTVPTTRRFDGRVMAFQGLDVSRANLTRIDDLAMIRVLQIAKFNPVVEGEIDFVGIKDL